MSQVDGHATAGLGVEQLLATARLVLTGGVLTFGLWSALPSLTQIEFPAPLALPTAIASPQAVPSAAASSAVGIQAALTRAQQSGRSVAVSISLSDRDLTRAAEPYLPQTYAGVTVSSPTLHVISGRIVLSATARSFVGSGPFVANATPYASDGRLMVRVDTVTLGGMALPDEMRGNIARQLQAAVDATTGSRLQVSSVSAMEGILTLGGMALP